jgi:hypothetical protein
MKILSVFICSAAICWLAIGCNGIFQPEFETTTVSQVRNASSHQISISAYEKDSIRAMITLLSGENLTDTLYYVYPSSIFSSDDSLFVTFDDSILMPHQKVNTFNVDRHLMENSSWEYDTIYEDRFGQWVQITYTFTNADFEEALVKGIKIE